MSDSGPPPKRLVGRSPTLLASPHPLQAAPLDAVAEQHSFADDVPKSGSEPVRENLLTVYPADGDAAPSAVSAVRKASGCCPLCNELVGARARTGVPCRRRVLDNAPSSLGLKLRDLCRFPCLGWCGKKPMPCCASKPPPQTRARATTAIDLVCTACYVKHSKIFKKPRHLCSDGQHLGLRRRYRGGATATHGLERQLQAPLAPKLSTGLTAGQGTQAPRTAHEGNFCRDTNVH
jgi:hypothetical protein